MFFVLKPQIYLFRILNPIILLLTVIILAKMSSFHEKPLDKAESFNISRDEKENPYLGVSLLCGCLFFLYLPLPIAHTTIYYAACAFNYLYPMALALLYGYWLYISPLKKRIPLLILSFFVASSTQQVGMIGIGYTVMFAIYLSFMQKRYPISTFVPYLLIQLIGYAILSYGSFQRLLSEKAAGNEAALGEVVSELTKTNIFSLPAAPFVTLLCLSCVFWLLHQANSVNLFHRILGITLGVATLGYLYFLLNENIVFQLPGKDSLTTVSIATLAFVLLYLFSLLYVSYLLMRQGQTPFLFINTINAIGAQLMLLVVDARFAATYKVMFPSLLLLSVFIFTSISAFRNNLLYLAFASGIITLLPQNPSLFTLYQKLSTRYPELLPWYHKLSSWYPFAGGEYLGFLLTFIAILVVILVVVIFPALVLPLSNERKSSFKIQNDPLLKAGFFFQIKKKLTYIMGVLIILTTFVVFSQNLVGYYSVSIPQNYNLQAIAKYHEKGREGELFLKKVPVSYYGYNLGNWQTMPHFLKECYKIKEDTPIRYLE